MKKWLLLFCCLSISFYTIAQEATFSVNVSSDSVLLGNYLRVTFLLKNANAQQFDPPTFEDFDVVSGPNTSSSMSVVNGVVSQSVSYSYYVQPRDIGNYYITAASVLVGDKTLETAPVEILVLPNPDGIIQRPQGEHAPRTDFFGNFPPPRPVTPPVPPKKKRKIYKM